MPEGVTTLAPITYLVAMPEPASHEFEIEMRVPALRGRDSVEIVFPTWAPGSYLVRDFVRHVFRLAVTDASGRPLARERLDKQRWRIQHRRAALRRPLSGVRVRGQRAHVVPRRQPRLLERHQRVLLRRGRAGTPVPRHRGAARGLEVAGRDRAAARAGRATWRPTSTSSATPRSRSARTRRARSRSGARNSSWRSTAAATPTPTRLVDILRRIVAATGRMFSDGGFPFDRYLFIVHALPVGSGGLEHRASVTMDITGLAFEDEVGYKRFADLAAHEFFHAWNVKRIRDAALMRFDYTQENYTRLLWLFEGFTDYLAHIIMLRAGITTDRDFYRMIAEDWPRVRDAPRPQRDAARRAVVRGVDQAVQAVGELREPRGQLLREGLLDGDGAGSGAAPRDRRPPRAARDVPLDLGALRPRRRARRRADGARRGRGDGGPQARSVLRALRARHRRAVRCPRCGGAPG